MLIFRKQALDDVSHLKSERLTRARYTFGYLPEDRSRDIFRQFRDYLRPPSELMEYLGAGVSIQYDYKAYQDFNSYHYGHLCLRFLQGDL